MQRIPTTPRENWQQKVESQGLIFHTLEELQVALTAVLQRYWQDARAVFSLIGKGWLLREANASGSSVLPA